MQNDEINQSNKLNTPVTNLGNADLAVDTKIDNKYTS